MNKEKDNLADSAKGGALSLESAKATEDLQWTKYKNQRGGHGFAAEDANAINDRLKGFRVDKEVGLSNEKDGPDRIVNGQMIQTKYYKSATDSVDSAFDKESGLFRYKKHLLEVPSDQYDDAIKLMEEKIRVGKVPGVKDPNEAERIIKKGSVTYRQAKNIAKAGNIDSLVFDIKTQSIVAVYAFGISFAIQYASCIWNGMDKKDALKLSVTSSFRTGSIVLGAGVITQQLLRTSLGRSFATFTSITSKRVVDQLYTTELGKKIIHKVASVMLGKNLAGAAAKNVIIKSLRTNLITATVTTAVMTIPDFYKALVNNKISWKQFTKNLTVNASGVAGGVAGAYGGATVGYTVGAAVGTLIAPGVGTAIGAKIGAAVGGFTCGVGLGLGAATGSKKLLDLITEDDAQEMFRLTQEMIVKLATDYMITEEEFNEQIEAKISNTITPKWLQDMYQSGGRYRDKASTQSIFAYEQLESIFEDTIKKRDVVFLPNEKTVQKEVRKINLFLFYQYLKMKIAKIFGIKSDVLSVS